MQNLKSIMFTDKDINIINDDNGPEEKNRPNNKSPDNNIEITGVDTTRVWNRINQKYNTIHSTETLGDITILAKKKMKMH